MALSDGLADPRPISMGEVLGLCLLFIALLGLLVGVGCRRVKGPLRPPMSKPPAPSVPANSSPTMPPSCPDGQIYSMDSGRCITPE